MSWIITGNSSSTVLHVSRSGFPCFHGRGSHELIIPDYGENAKEENRAVISRIEAATCAWAVTMPEDNPAPFSGTEWLKLAERARNDSSKMHGVIFYLASSHSDLPDLVQVVAMPPKSTFTNIQRLFEFVLTTAELRYQIEIDFWGFEMDENNLGAISWAEFVAGRPHFFSGVSFSVIGRDDA